MGCWASEAYRWLNDYGGIEGKYEAQTILTMHNEVVTEITKRLQEDYLRKKAKHEADKAADCETEMKDYLRKTVKHEAKEADSEKEMEQDGRKKRARCEGPKTRAGLSATEADPASFQNSRPAAD